MGIIANARLVLDWRLSIETGGRLTFVNFPGIVQCPHRLC
jgi:hypothetical protein